MVLSRGEHQQRQSNLVVGGNGDQRVGYVGVKTEGAQIGVYNDFFPGVGDGKDRFNTGGGSLQVLIMVVLLPLVQMFILVQKLLVQQVKEVVGQTELMLNKNQISRR